VGDAYLLKATDRRYAEEGACGGAVPALLRYALEEGLVEAVVCVEEGTDPLDPRPIVVDDPDDVPAGTYHVFHLPLSTVATSVVEGGTKPVAVTCRPCDSTALSELEACGALPKGSTLKVGLNCGGTFHPRTIAEILEHLGREPSELLGETIEKGRLRLLFEDGIEEIPLKDLESEGRGRREACRRCEVSVPRDADVACGNWGVPGELSGKYTLVEVLSEPGRRLVEGAIEAGFVTARPAPEDALSVRDLMESRLAEMAHEAESVTRFDPSRCVRCLGCRFVCPVCAACEEEGCREFAGRGVPPSPVWLERAAGCVAPQCVDCGACSDVCPAGIDPSPQSCNSTTSPSSRT